MFKPNTEAVLHVKTNVPVEQFTRLPRHRIEFYVFPLVNISLRANSIRQKTLHRLDAQ